MAIFYFVFFAILEIFCNVSVQILRPPPAPISVVACLSGFRVVVYFSRIASLLLKTWETGINSDQGGQGGGRGGVALLLIFQDSTRISAGAGPAKGQKEVS